MHISWAPWNGKNWPWGVPCQEDILCWDGGGLEGGCSSLSSQELILELTGQPEAELHLGWHLGLRQALCATEAGGLELWGQLLGLLNPRLTWGPVLSPLLLVTCSQTFGALRANLREVLEASTRWR